MLKSFAIGLSLAAGLAGAALWMAQAPALAQTATGAARPDYKQAQAEIWAIEQSIYATRARGSMQVIIDHQSPYSQGWPAISQAFNSKAIKKPFTEVRGPNSLKGDKERVEMIFLDMAYDGQTAVNMYKTHKTQMSDGSPADDYFEVTHVWTKENGKWMLLTGRPQPVSPPEK